jgi:hypothetical protein
MVIEHRLGSARSLKPLLYRYTEPTVIVSKAYRNFRLFSRHAEAKRA